MPPVASWYRDVRAVSLGWCNMRPEIRVGLIVGLIAIAGGSIWWFSRTDEQGAKIPFDKSTVDAGGSAALTGDAIPTVRDTRPGAERAVPPPSRRQTPVAGPVGHAEPAAPQPGPLAPSPAANVKPAEEALSELPPVAREGAKPIIRPLPGELSQPAEPQPTTRPAEALEPPPPAVEPPRLRGAAAEPRPAPAPATPPRPPPRKRHVIQRGDRLIDLARDEYGDGDLWKAIKAANPNLKNENVLKIGEVIELPSREEALQLVASPPPGQGAKKPREEAESGGAKPAPARAEGQATGAAPPPARDRYVVSEGDTLVKIARTVLKNEERWREIFELNRDRLQSPDLIRVGMELRLPPLEKPPSGQRPARDANARG